MERVNKDRRAKRGEVIANYKYSISERERYYSSMVFGVGIVLMCYGSIFMINLLLGILSEINGEELTHMFPHMLTLFVNIPLYIIIGMGYIYVIIQIFNKVVEITENVKEGRNKLTKVYILNGEDEDIKGETVYISQTVLEEDEEVIIDGKFEEYIYRKDLVLRYSSKEMR